MAVIEYGNIADRYAPAIYAPTYTLVVYLPSKCDDYGEYYSSSEHYVLPNLSREEAGIVFGDFRRASLQGKVDGNYMLYVLKAQSNMQSVLDIDLMKEFEASAEDGRVHWVDKMEAESILKANRNEAEALAADIETFLTTKKRIETQAQGRALLNDLLRHNHTSKENERA